MSQGPPSYRDEATTDVTPLLKIALISLLTILHLTGPAITPLRAEAVDAVTLLRRADLVRNPFLGTSTDIEVSVVDRTTGRPLRRGKFHMLTRKGGQTLLLISQQGWASAGGLLIADDTYWLLLPEAEAPVALPFGQVVAGEISHAGFLRLDLRLHYQPRVDGEEVLGEMPCWRLELLPKSTKAFFSRIRYWVAKDNQLPIRLEFYAAEKLLKTAHFVRYQDTGWGPRPAEIEIEDQLRPGEKTSLILGKPRGAKTSGLDFDVEDLIALRNAAHRLAEEGVTTGDGGRLLQALRENALDRTQRRP